jgi:hypothetical protein
MGVRSTDGGPDVSGVASKIKLWDDNPTAVDMLGFEPVVDTVVAAVCSPTLDPVTVALQSSWGGGKSTALQLVEAKLGALPGVVVVTCDPWEYDDLPKSEIRNLVISQVLERLSTDQSFKDRAKGLLKRIGWAKVGATIANMALARELDVDKLVDVFTPGSAQPTSMAGFRSQFADLVAETPDLEKVVVLIDDLDRCSPDSVVAILEAVKVFLAVPKMAFVIAAEEALIRFAIERSANSGARSTYSDRYLEKIVQIPVRLPTLSRDDAETYIALLLASHRDPGVGTALVAHVAGRRVDGTKPYLGAPFPSGTEPHQDDLLLAAQVASGLSHDKWSSPRAIKRFLNAWGVRVSIAQARGAELDLDVMLKLYILEDRFPKSFEALVSQIPEERGAFIDQWEKWAAGDSESDADKPEKVDDGTKEWAAAGPSLRRVSGKIDTYLTVAATFTSFSAAEGLSSEVLALLDDLISDSDAVRRQAVTDIQQFDVSIRESAVTRLLERSGAVSTAIAIESAKDIAKSDPSLPAVFQDAVRMHALPYIEPGSVPDIVDAGGDALTTLEALRDRAGIPAVLKSVVEDEIASLRKQQGR